MLLFLVPIVTGRSQHVRSYECVGPWEKCLEKRWGTARIHDILFVRRHGRPHVMFGLRGLLVALQSLPERRSHAMEVQNISARTESTQALSERLSAAQGLTKCVGYQQVLEGFIWPSTLLSQPTSPKPELPPSPARDRQYTTPSLAPRCSQICVQSYGRHDTARPRYLASTLHASASSMPSHGLALGSSDDTSMGSNRDHRSRRLRREYWTKLGEGQ